MRCGSGRYHVYCKRSYLSIGSPGVQRGVLGCEWKLDDLNQDKILDTTAHKQSILETKWLPQHACTLALLVRS